MTDEKLSRRQLLRTAIAGLAAVPAAGLIAGNAGAEMLSESDATAKSLGYVAEGPVFLQVDIEHRHMVLDLTPGRGDP